ncbi:hypothetical protein DL93DRAFT_2096595 [Clavulina sp. PMI_390]|nr:hypothetical protein DL93DRAFT_2096595 [Clavulina sp. PMI_390]
MGSLVNDYDIPPSTSQPALSNESLETLKEFFIDDDGNQMVILPEPTSASSKNAPLTRAESRTSLMSVTSTNTVGTVIPTHGIIDLPLAEICDYIDQYRSLQQAYIVSSECFSQRVGAVTHRFLVLQLRRPRRKENCWFFCSLIQQHLAGARTGWFVDGNLKHANLASDIRLRVSSRVWNGRKTQSTSQQPAARSIEAPVPEALNPELTEKRGPSPQYPRPHVPYEGPSAELIGKLHDLDDDATVEDETIKAKVKTALALAPNIAIIDSLSKSMRKRADKFSNVIDEIDTFLGNSPEREPDTLIYRTELVRLQRALYLDTPLSSQGDLARLLRNQALTLHKRDRDEEACVLDEEALAIRREGYRVRPGATRARLAAMLHTYSIHLYSIKRFKEALSTNEEAVVLRRLLYEYDPDEYIDLLASSLENLGVRRGSVERLEEAKLVEAEALVLRRIMYEKDPEKSRKALADCLHNYGITLDGLGLPKESRTAHAERDALRALMNEGKTTP